MSFPTTPAFVHVGTWDNETRKHPAMKWMEEYTLSFNKRAEWDKEESEWVSFSWFYSSEFQNDPTSSSTYNEMTHHHLQLSPDFTFVRPDGKSSTGNAAAFAESKTMYQHFTSEFHDPCFIITWETEFGWEMIGQAHIFANLRGNATAQEEKVQDSGGRDWDIKVPAAFHFWYVRKEGAPHGGIVMEKKEVMCDSLPAMQRLTARGVFQQP
ncbi:hypothetical protein PMIN01_11502 [Paraphaeosphaeria minitans]|uniref:Uncharacterized protein n=1 Tax=Paraphaeosphaeria minitans TaxID=565426 RepID=A0A9P6G8U2_9PLEO|nr:hypothetical protein PMIN01_11502 [Paraphaeosphaeria minitans]